MLHARAIGELQSRIYENAEPLRVAAVPSTANPLRWRGVVSETRDFYAPCPMSIVMPAFDPTRARIVHKAAEDPAMDAARRTDTFQIMLRFSEFPEWSVSPAESPEDAKLVSVMDMRFLGWGANAIVDAHGRVLRTWLLIGGLKPR